MTSRAGLPSLIPVYTHLLPGVSGNQVFPPTPEVKFAGLIDASELPVAMLLVAAGLEITAVWADLAGVGGPAGALDVHPAPSASTTAVTNVILRDIAARLLRRCLSGSNPARAMIK